MSLRIMDGQIGELCSDKNNKYCIIAKVEMEWKKNNPKAIYKLLNIKKLIGMGAK